MLLIFSSRPAPYHNDQVRPSAGKISGEGITNSTAGTGDEGGLVVIAHRETVIRVPVDVGVGVGVG